MKSYRVSIKKYEHLPIRIRPWFVVFTVIVMLALGFLGFTNFPDALPVNDKVLHFFCLGLATGVLYWVFDVEEDSRRIWIWRHFSLIFTGVTCLFFGGILSEVVQSFLPYKHFQFGDVVANISGSTIGLMVSYHLERRYRKRRELMRLYQPVQGSAESSESEDDSFLPLPLHRSPKSPAARFKARRERRNLDNIWDSSDPLEIFAITDDEDEFTPSPRTGVSFATDSNVKSNVKVKAPQIVVTAPSNGIRGI